MEHESKEQKVVYQSQQRLKLRNIQRIITFRLFILSCLAFSCFLYAIISAFMKGIRNINTIWANFSPFSHPFDEISLPVIFTASDSPFFFRHNQSFLTRFSQFKLKVSIQKERERNGISKEYAKQEGN